MTQFRKTEIASIFSRWLDRYSPPKALAAKPQALADEQDSLLGVFLKMAPRDEYTPFVNRVLDKLEYQLTARVWPSKGELGAACSNVAKEIAKGAQGGSGWQAPEGDRDMRPQAIIARRMQAGEAVGEEWLWGASAVLLVAEKLIDERTMSGYRSAAFHARSDAYGRDKALMWEAERKETHRIAADLHKARTDEKTPREIDLRATVAAA